MNRVLITGATGYIGGSIASKLLQLGYQVTGLVRSQEGATALEKHGIKPILGSLDDFEPLKKLVTEHDIVIHAADSDHTYAVTTMLSALAGSGKTFIHTSGSSIVGDKAAGEYQNTIYHEETIQPLPEKLARVEIDRLVLRSAHQNIRTIVICPTMIYGDGLGIKRDSIQVPRLIHLAAQRGIGSHIGRGENVWSNVHIEDLVDLYLLAMQHAPAGSFFFAEQGEASMKEIATIINDIGQLGDLTQSIGIDEGIKEWGVEGAHFAFGSNSRVSADKARKWLGWSPTKPSLMEELTQGCYVERLQQLSS